LTASSEDSSIADVLRDIDLENYLIPDGILVAKTLLRLPQEVQFRVRSEVRFITMTSFTGLTISLKSSRQWIILLNFDRMKQDHLSEKGIATCIAHEIAHFILGHTTGTSETERDADDLCEKWGFGREYDDYKKFQDPKKNATR